MKQNYSRAVEPESRVPPGAVQHREAPGVVDPKTVQAGNRIKIIEMCTLEQWKDRLEMRNKHRQIPLLRKNSRPKMRKNSRHTHNTKYPS